MKQTKLILLSLNARIGREVAKEIAMQLGLAFVDCKERLLDKLLKSEKLFTSLDLKDLQVQENAVVREVIGQENTVIFLDYELYNTNKESFNELPKFYLRLSKSELEDADKLNILNFNSRDQKLMQTCKTVEYICKENAILKIKQFLGEK